MVLTLAEKKSLSNLLQEHDQGELNVFLYLHISVPLSNISSAYKPMPSIAYDVVRWLDARPLELMQALHAAVTAFPHYPETAALNAAIVRIEALPAMMMPASPWDVRLVGLVPVVNRTRLRQLLQAISSGSPPPVVRVDGPSGTGRSHSRYLIKHVAECCNIDLIHVDLDSRTAARHNLPAIVGRMVRELNLGPFEHPTTDGVTAETIGWRYADDFASVWRAAHRPRPAWFVFDSLEHHHLTEVRAFVSTLVEFTLRQEIGNCVVFLLGAGSQYVFDDPHWLVGMEQLGIFTSTEIAAYINDLNQLGRTPLVGAALNQRTQEITKLLGQSAAHEACGAVCRELARLRMEVNV